MNNNKEYIAIAYGTYLSLFISKAYNHLGDTKDAEDCVQNILVTMLRSKTLKLNNVEHAKHIILGSIKRESVRIIKKRTIPANLILLENIEEEQVKNSIMEYYPISGKYLSQLHKLDDLKVNILMLYLSGVTCNEIIRKLNLNICKESLVKKIRTAIDMIKEYRITKRKPSHYSRKINQKVVEETNLILKYINQGVQQAKIAEMLGLTLGQVKGRKEKAFKILERVKNTA